MCTIEDLGLTIVSDVPSVYLLPVQSAKARVVFSTVAHDYLASC